MASPQSTSPNMPQPLKGASVIIAGALLGLANFIVVLDTTIANVSIPHISGSLGVASNQGTWVVTSYAVAEAISVPLTGWLVRRFGTVRMFIFSLVGFGCFSALCGLSASLSMLVIFRVGQGLCGGPLMPLTQTLLLRIFPKEQHGGATALWAMTTLIAPIIGPILGGVISDNWSWPWIFYINVPIVAVCAMGAYRMLRSTETKTERVPIDTVGLALMVAWIAPLQLMLDLGQDRDWFGSTFIIALAVIAVLCFIAFMIWELTEKEPIVDLRVFRYRGYAVSVLVLALSFGCFFAAVVLIPQWLQQGVGYTATQAGYVTAFQGILAIVAAPIVAKLSAKIDTRILVCVGIAGLGAASLMRTFWSTDGDFWLFSLPQLFQGIWMPFFFIPLTTIALGSVDPSETASAAGVMNFLRTLAGAVGTSVATSMWADQTRVARSELTNELHANTVLATVQHLGMSLARARGLVEQLVEQQSSSLAANHVFMISAFAFFACATLIWLAPRPRDDVDTSAAH